MSTATAEPPAKTQQPTARILGKTIKLGADFDPSKHEIIRTAVPFTLKALNDDERTIEFIGSSATRDRYGDSVNQTGWELANFVKNPVIPWGHNYSQPPVAQAVEVGLREGKLFFKGKFATAEEYEFADTIYKLYKGGYLRAFSVGFIPLEWEVHKDRNDDGDLIDYWWEFTKCELLEVSCVTVPANPEALVLGFKDGSFSDREKSLLVGQAQQLLKTLTDIEEPVINEDMQKQLEELAELCKTLASEVAELKELVAKNGAAEEAPANASDDPDAGTEGKALTADEIRAQVRATIKAKVDHHTGKID